MTTIKLKNGSGAPTAGDLAQGEPALDLTNKRLYTEDSGGTVIEVGVNPTSVTTGDITATGTATFAGLTTTADVAFGDNDKALFGAGDDLQIYHDGSASYIADTGTGTLNIKASGSIRLRGNDTDELLARFNENGSNQFYYDNAEKLATTNTGIDVTGTVTADGLTVDTDTLVVDSANNRVGIGTSSPDTLLHLSDTAGGAVIRLERNDTTIASTDVYGEIQFEGQDASAGSAAGIRGKILGVAEGATGEMALAFQTASGYGSSTERMRIDSSGQVGIGTDSPAQALAVESSSAGVTRVNITNTGNAAAGAGVQLVTKNGATQVSNATLRTDNAGNFSIFSGTTTEAERMRIDSSGNLIVGGTSYEQAGSIGFKGTGEYSSVLSSGAGGEIYAGGAIALVSNGYQISVTTGNAQTYKWHNGTTRSMTLDSSGNLLVGKTSADNTTQGVRIYSTGRQSIVSEADTALIVNRRTSDGTIIDLRKDGTAVGQINARSGDLVIGTGTTGLQFYDVGNAIFPLSASGNTNRDAAIDLGETSNRFKDLYLSGRVVADGVTTSAHAWSSQSDSTSSSAHLYFRNPNGFVGNISTSGTATAYNTSSDYRLKENVVAMSGATERLKQLAPKRFNFIADADTTVDGFLAHEVADVVPEAVTGAKDAVDDDGNAVYQGIDQSKLVPLLVATIQELEARIAALESN